MKFVMNALVMFVLLLMLTACTTTDPKAVDIPGAMDEKLVWSSAAQRPGWTMEEPDTVEGLMSFVGLSGRYATEQGAREDARRNATSSVVKYMGTLAKDKFERARVGYGLSSSVVDPTASSRQFEKQLAVNMATKVKVKKWYMEKWQTKDGAAWQAFVLAHVPSQAIDATFKKTAKGMAKEAERRAKDASDATAKDQAKKAADFWKQMQSQGVVE